MGRESWLLCLICLPGVLWWLSGASSRCHGVVCGLWLWYFLIILIYYFLLHIQWESPITLTSWFSLDFRRQQPLTCKGLCCWLSIWWHFVCFERLFKIITASKLRQMPVFLWKYQFRPIFTILNIIHRWPKFFSVKIWIFLGALKNCFIEMVLLSTHNLCYHWEIRNLNYTLLSRAKQGFR